MGYRCPICGFTTNTDALLARHMVNTFTLYEHHIEWIESKGISVEEYSPFRDLKRQKSFYKALCQVMKADCTIEEAVLVR